MRLTELLTTVSKSSPTDWHVVPCGNQVSSGGPSFLDLVSAWQGSEGTVVEVESHHHRATYEPDVAIGLAWGMSDLNDQRRFNWAKRFADESTYPSLLDVFYYGMLVHRELGLVVDGGRCVLPWPKRSSVSGLAVDLFRLTHNLENSVEDFDEYLSRAGFTWRRQSRVW